ncbi:MAG: glycosyltransferase family 2 protein [Acidobacteriota bacterium]
MKLSVLIPCLDAEGTLGAQLEALAGQSWDDDWEVIVADNGSRDRSRAIVEEWRRRVPGLRLVDAGDRRGQAHARNLAAAAASGEGLLFCDADDVVAPGWLAAMGRALGEYEFVASRYDYQLLNPPWVQRNHLNPQRDGLPTYDYPTFLPHAGGGGLGVRRAVHVAVGGFDESLPALEDTDYCWRIQLAGHALHFVPDAVVNVRHRGDLGGIFRQGVSYGRHNVLIYRRYRGRGMPRLGLLPGLLRWGTLALRTPILLLTRAGRARWLWQLGWRVGRIRGCLAYRVVAP